MTAPFPFPIPAWTIASHQPQSQMFQNIHVLKTMPTARRKLSGMTQTEARVCTFQYHTITNVIWTRHSQRKHYSTTVVAIPFQNVNHIYGLHEMWLVVSRWDSDRLQWGQSHSKLKWSGSVRQYINMWNRQSSETAGLSSNTGKIYSREKQLLWIPHLFQHCCMRWIDSSRKLCTSQKLLVLKVRH